MKHEQTFENMKKAEEIINANKILYFVSLVEKEEMSYDFEIRKFEITGESENSYIVMEFFENAEQERFYSDEDVVSKINVELRHSTITCGEFGQREKITAWGRPGEVEGIKKILLERLRAEGLLAIRRFKELIQTAEKSRMVIQSLIEGLEL